MDDELARAVARINTELAEGVMDDELARAVARIAAKVWWMLPRSVKIESIEPFLRGSHQCIGVSVRRDGLVRATTEYWGKPSP